MAYTYRVYGVNDVDNAANEFYRLSGSAPTFSQSAATRQARAQADNYAQQYRDTVNGGYKSAYQNSIDSLARRYTGNKFGWEPSTSAEYQNMGDRYRREAENAQENAAGAYSANTGGYSNSYAQAAGQRAYDQTMKGMTSQIPTLKQNAMNAWSRDQQNTLDQISLMRGLDDQQYQRYRDKVQDNYDFMTYYENKYGTSAGLDMSAFQQELTRWQAQMGAAQGNLANIRQLAEQQYEHNTLSADAQAGINSNRAQTDAYYNYLMSRVR